MLLILALFNLGLLASVLLRRLVKGHLFALHDERRLRWASVVEEVLRRGEIPENLPPLRSDRSRAAAEEVMLLRARSATQPQQHLLRSLLYQWSLLEWRQTHLRRGGKREQALSALTLGRFRCPEVLPDLVALLQRAPSTTQVAVVNALGLLGEPAAIDALVEFLVERGPWLTRPVLSALIHCGRGAPDRLARQLLHPQQGVRTLVAAALAEVASSRELPALTRAASDAEPEVRAKVARALGRTGEPRAAEALAGLAQDPIWYVRLQAIGALAQLPLPANVKFLWQALGDKDWRVREKAAQALYNSSEDTPYLLRQALERLTDRYALGALVSVLEREGVTWQAINRLASPSPNEQEESQALLAELLRAEGFATSLYALEMHPEPGVRRQVMRLVRQHAPPSVQGELKQLLASPRLDQQTRGEIHAWLAESKV